MIYTVVVYPRLQIDSSTAPEQFVFYIWHQSRKVSVMMILAAWLCCLCSTAKVIKYSLDHFASNKLYSVWSQVYSQHLEPFTSLASRSIMPTKMHRLLSKHCLNPTHINGLRYPNHSWSCRVILWRAIWRFGAMWTVRLQFCKITAKSCEKRRKNGDFASETHLFFNVLHFRDM